MRPVAADAAPPIPTAVDRGGEKACRCTADAVVGDRDAAQAVAGLRAAMSVRRS
jgi:hypothetical protein